MNLGSRYALNWGDHSNHLKKAFDALLTAKELVDVTLSCEGKKVVAHKMLLSACSTYFHDLLRDNPCQHPIIILRGVKFESLVTLLKFIYTGEVSVFTEELDEFLKIGETFRVKGLFDEDANSDETEKENLSMNIVKEEKQVLQETTIRVETLNEMTHKRSISRNNNKKKFREEKTSDFVAKSKIADIGEDMNFISIIHDNDDDNLKENGSKGQILKSVKKETLQNLEGNINMPSKADMKIDRRKKLVRNIVNKHEKLKKQKVAKLKQIKTEVPDEEQMKIEYDIPADEFHLYANEKKLKIGWAQWIQKKLEDHNVLCKFKSICYSFQRGKRATTAYIKGFCSSNCPVNYKGKIFLKKDEPVAGILLKIEKYSEFIVHE
ncbi:hypothetical protein FQA39_LY16081 [Lamprigera yunnana]|nr:hypothetical protein FQA39_LY16081 [Lamprigera yunnana]